MLYLDGKKIDSFDSEVDVLSHDARYIQGEAVYTSLRTYGRRPFQLDKHLGRLQESAQIMGYGLCDDIDSIRGWVVKVLASDFKKDQFLKITATPRHTVITWRDLDIKPEIYQGVRVLTQPLVRKNVKVKSNNTKDQKEALKAAEEMGCYEALLLNPESGRITEGAFSNILWLKGGKLFWCDNALSGITQAAVMELAGPLGLPLEQGELDPAELGHLEELFLTQTSKGIVPIVQVDAIQIADGKPGQKTLALMEAFAVLTKKPSR